MKFLLPCLLCTTVANTYARDDSLMYKNMEFYEKNLFLKIRLVRLIILTQQTILLLIIG